jgi:hypothetical protein
VESHNGETWLVETSRQCEAGERPKRPAGRRRRGHRLTVASARLRSRSATAALQNCALEPSAKSRILDRLMASPEQAIRSHRAGNRRFAGRQSRRIQPRPHSRLRASPPHVARPGRTSDDSRPTSTRRASEPLGSAQYDMPKADGIPLRVTHVGPIGGFLNHAGDPRAVHMNASGAATRVTTFTVMPEFGVFGGRTELRVWVSLSLLHKCRPPAASEEVGRCGRAALVARAVFARLPRNESFRLSTRLGRLSFMRQAPHYARRRDH